MADQKMTAAEREEFLAGLHVGVVGLERTDGPPLVLPIWYTYEPGGDVEFITGESSLKGRLAASAGRGSLCAQQEAPPYKYVTVDGPLTIEPLSDSRPALEPIAIRYLGDELGKKYASGSDGAGSVLVRLRPERWFSVDYGKS